jgi:hypothetical protein
LAKGLLEELVSLVHHFFPRKDVQILRLIVNLYQLAKISLDFLIIEINLAVTVPDGGLYNRFITWCAMARSALIGMHANPLLLI